MEEEKEQMVEEEEMESMFSPNALLSPLQATPGPVLASFPFYSSPSTEGVESTRGNSVCLCVCP